ncbi:transmembrane protein, putative (macronuclear) [Tetrahymena thermophila SB210]|uniref:Transmembrane protein, putative n=1 Tax=Tetrahymena thermophila (strain SB210) TaxID=312017 RepID=W7XGC2_TETTS|nr:transmembrane protein, putative [Tetrahymena thermophila SB210]EWS71919.1 transmembrane protein, putative [Tetrahymena thermophila SB210]|eukprot:XP_012655548.1 transmembrane protein, putative [Tetrahymena thermophila SB210]
MEARILSRITLPPTELQKIQERDPTDNNPATAKKSYYASFMADLCCQTVSVYSRFKKRSNSLELGNLYFLITSSEQSSNLSPVQLIFILYLLNLLLFFTNSLLFAFSL